MFGKRQYSNYRALCREYKVMPLSEHLAGAVIYYCNTARHMQLGSYFAHAGDLNAGIDILEGTLATALGEQQPEEVEWVTPDAVKKLEQASAEPYYNERQGD